MCFSFLTFLSFVELMNRKERNLFLSEGSLSICYSIKPVKELTLTAGFVLVLNSQQPVDSDQEADVLSGQPHRREDQEHGHESRTGDTGCSDTGQGGCHTAQETSPTLSGTNHRLTASDKHTHCTRCTRCTLSHRIPTKKILFNHVYRFTVFKNVLIHACFMSIYRGKII